MTRDDLLLYEGDLTRTRGCCSPGSRAPYSMPWSGDASRRLELAPEGLDRVDAYIDGRAARSVTARNDGRPIRGGPIGDSSANGLELRGSRADVHAHVHRVTLEAGMRTIALRTLRRRSVCASVRWAQSCFGHAASRPIRPVHRTGTVAAARDSAATAFGSF
ncbi:MAG: hypothetical protein JW940_37375 [Polyangiaceae bacterium]|nr:hypothetical protein [Polyangiaceae bacterium]